MEKTVYTLMIAGMGGFIRVKLRVPAGTLIGTMIAVSIFNISTGYDSTPSKL